MKHELQEMEAYKKVYQQYSLSRVDAHVKIEETKDKNVKEEIDDEKNGQETVSYRSNKYLFHIFYCTKWAMIEEQRVKKFSWRKRHSNTAILISIAANILYPSFRIITF